MTEKGPAGCRTMSGGCGNGAPGRAAADAVRLCQPGLNLQPAAVPAVAIASTRVTISSACAHDRRPAPDGAIGASARQYGELIVPTSVTEITADGPRYRGHLAADLAAQHASFESVAELLWTGQLYDVEQGCGAVPLPASVLSQVHAVTATGTQETFLEVLALVELQLGTSRSAIEHRLRKGEVPGASRQVIQTIAGCLRGLSPRRRFVPVDSEQGVAWSALVALGGSPMRRLPGDGGDAGAAGDHELATGAFAACVEPPAAPSCTAAGLGPLHPLRRSGGAPLRRSRALPRQSQPARTAQAGAREPASWPRLPGFLRPLYPKGDPRAQFLLKLARQRRNLLAPLVTLMDFWTARTSRSCFNPAWSCWSSQCAARWAWRRAVAPPSFRWRARWDGWPT